MERDGGISPFLDILSEKKNNCEKSWDKTWWRLWKTGKPCHQLTKRGMHNLFTEWMKYKVSITVVVVVAAIDVVVEAVVIVGMCL